jgi:L-amino acid N-acyltransferase YncA
VSAELTVRPTTPGDLDAIGEIYAHYVQTGFATFELTAPDRAEMLCRFHTITSAGLPFLTATLDGAVVGYAYFAPWKTRPAYRLTVEDSVYIAPWAVGCGIGGRLLDALLADCERIGIREVIAVIVDGASASSLALHRNRGFVDADRLTSVGFKDGRWLDILVLQKHLDGADVNAAGR